MLTTDSCRVDRGGQRFAIPLPACDASRLMRRPPEQMRQGTIKVREALGAEYSNISNKQIEEALWNYYYDVGKSVTYLKSETSSGAFLAACG